MAPRGYDLIVLAALVSDDPASIRPLIKLNQPLNLVKPLILASPIRIP